MDIVIPRVALKKVLLITDHFISDAQAYPTPNQTRRTIPGRRQSKTLSKIDECGSKIDRNSVFDCHLSPVGRQMAIENTVSMIFDLRSSKVLVRLPPTRRENNNMLCFVCLF